ncbi:alpha/beta hydrolase [Echinicola shivajiensis]|uniref:alpha/beta hydrolase n=1 Tax=Echinicola shivajiensis TaxID=1035916 RepID=UPI001BFC584E|nr:alpha/beta hydrolase-fold protein [Echinicola shivajiensis]
MKKILIIAQLVFLILSSSCKDKQPANGTYEVINIPAHSLKNNLIGTDTIQQIGVYLPPSYHISNKSYPVVYFLLGHATKVMENSPEIFKIMEHETSQEMIYVQMSGYNFYKGSMYANSPVIGNWEDYVTLDVISFMDNNYRTIPDKASRGLAGHSMGGLGAFNISLNHPDKYSCIQLMSPAISAGDDIINWMFSNDSIVMSLKSLSYKMEGIHDHYTENLTRAMNEVGDLWLGVGYGVAFSPDAGKSLLMDSPFYYKDDGTFEKNESVWELWRNGAGNIPGKVKRFEENLKSYTYYGMDVGYYDQLGFNVRAVKELSSYMTEEHIPHSVHIFNGDHYNRMNENLEYRIMPQMSIFLQVQQ